MIKKMAIRGDPGDKINPGKATSIHYDTHNCLRASFFSFSTVEETVATQFKKYGAISECEDDQKVMTLIGFTGST